ncbi:unnamed protein product [Ixodes pacificus]
MSVVTRRLGSTHFDVFCKGAPETIASLSKPESVPPDFGATLTWYTQQGHRVLALAHRPLTAGLAKVHRLPREELECGLTFVGLLVMENRLKPETTAVIRTLRRADVRAVMVTGDNMLTAVSVARDCEMIERDQEVLILSSSTDSTDSTPVLSWQSSEAPRSKGSFDCLLTPPVSRRNLLPSKLFAPLGAVEKLKELSSTSAATRKAALMAGVSGADQEAPESTESFIVVSLDVVAVCGTVFARMAPDQKQQLIELLQEMGYYVGMCGDGANDCGALKAAHAGISLSETEASVASPFTSKVANISCVPTLIKEGRAALVTSFGILKYMACYSMTQFTSVLILYSLYSNLTDLEFLYIDLFLITLFAALFGRTEPHPVLHKRPPPSSLMGITPLASILSQIVLVIVTQVFALITLWGQKWYRPHVAFDSSNRDEEELQCHDNYAVFAVSVFQYITLAVIFSRGRPYRKSILSNYLFMGSLVVMTSFTLYLILYPADFLVNALELDIADADIGFRCMCAAIALSHFVIAYVLENYFVQGFLFKQVQMRFYSGRPPYKELQEELRGDQSPWAPLSRESSITSAPSSHEGSLLRPRLALLDDSLPSSPPSRKGEAEELAVMANGTSGAVAGAGSGGGGDGDCAPYVTHM